VPYYIWRGLGTLVASFDEEEAGIDSAICVENHPALAEVPIRQGNTEKCVQLLDIPMFFLHYKEGPWKEQYVLQWGLHRENRRR